MSLLAEVTRTLRPPPGDRHGPLVPMMLALTFVTGAFAVAVAFAIVVTVALAVQIASRGDGAWIRA